MDALSTALRPLVQPVARSLPAPVRDLGVALIGPRCYQTLLLDVRLDHAECLKLAVSKGLGIAIIAASSVVKVPQIVKLAGSRSADGVSFLAYLLETSAYLITLAYNVRNGFPFSTFGETALILGQNIVISVLVLKYSGRAALAAVLVAVLAAAAAGLFAPGLVDITTMSVLQAGAGLLGVASKLPQILAIYRQGGTGQLSAFAVRAPLLLFAEPRDGPRGCRRRLTGADRSSTTSPARCRASLPRCRRWTTSSSSTASSRALCSTPCWRPRWCTTGTRRRKRRGASARSRPFRAGPTTRPRRRRPRARRRAVAARPRDGGRWARPGFFFIFFLFFGFILFF